MKTNDYSGGTSQAGHAESVGGHRREPWSTIDRDGAFDVVGDGRLIADLVNPDNARRIVACVNACAGIPSEHLEQFASTGLLQTSAFKQQRDDLLEALELCKFDSLNMSMVDLGFIRAAIAKAQP